MKKIIFTLLVLLTFSLRVNPDTSTSEINPESSLFPGLAEKVSFNLRGADVIETIKYLSEKGNLNIITTSKVTGKVTLFLKDVSIDEALLVILLANNLACDKKNNIITIMTESEYKAIYGGFYGDKKKLKAIVLKYADAVKVSVALSNIKSDIGNIIPDSATGIILVIDVPEKIKEMEELAKKLDLPTINRILPVVTEVFELSYAKAVDLEPNISSLLSEGAGSIRIDERTNKIIVTDLPHSLEKIKEVVRSFDAQDRQVLIEAKIVEVVLSDDFNMGVDWDAAISNSRSMTLAGTFPFSSTSASSLAVSIGSLDADNYQAALTFIESLGNTKIISSPRITVCNNQEATFMVGTRQAYVVSATTLSETAATTSENIEFIEVGIILYVTPVINKEGFVKMHIKPEISSVTDWLETTEGNKIPIVDTSNIETEVLIKDGRTIIIAGLIKETNSTTRNEIPGVSDLPVFGEAFKNISRSKETSEIIIFLTPHIIGDTLSEGA